METMWIELTHEKAPDLIRDLEAMDIIRVLQRQPQPTGNLSDRFAGKLSAHTTEALQRHVIESRNEWDQNDT